MARNSKKDQHAKALRDMKAARRQMQAQFEKERAAQSDPDYLAQRRAANIFHLRTIQRKEMEI